MSIRSVIAAIEQILQNVGCVRAEENFTLERLPASTAHLSYTLGRLELRPRYLSSGVADYIGARLPILIALKVHGPHNTAGTYSNAYLSALDTYQQLENNLVAAQLSEHGENNAIEHTSLQPLAGPGNQEYLLLTITLSLDLLRTMNP